MYNVESPYCFEKLSSVCFLLSFPPAMGGSNVSNSTQPISHWDHLSSAALYLHHSSSTPSSILLFAIDRYMYLRSTLSPIQPSPFRRIRYDYRWYSCIFRPTITSGFTSSVAVIPMYLKVRCYGQAYVISALAYAVPDPQFSFPLFSYAATCGICGSFTYLSCARRENICKYVCMCRREAFGVNVPDAQSTIGCAKIAGENCKENVMVNRGREEETLEAIQKCGRRIENPLCESIHSAESLDSPITCFGCE